MQVLLDHFEPILVAAGIEAPALEREWWSFKRAVYQDL